MENRNKEEYITLSFKKEELTDSFWKGVSSVKGLSEDFIREFEDKVDWDCISEFQKLSEDFIREFKDEVNWYNIYMHQTLSEEFIREFKDKVDWEMVYINQKSSGGFIKEFCPDYIDYDTIKTWVDFYKKRFILKK